MKKLFTLSLAGLALAVLVIASCKKKAATYCWQCTTAVTITPAVITGSSTTHTQVCDKTEDDIATYQKANTSTTTSNNNGYTMTTVTSTTCTK